MVAIDVVKFSPQMPLSLSIYCFEVNKNRNLFDLTTIGAKDTFKNTCIHKFVSTSM